jgi:hypothetical protein
MPLSSRIYTYISFINAVPQTPDLDSQRYMVKDAKMTQGGREWRAEQGWNTLHIVNLYINIDDTLYYCNVKLIVCKTRWDFMEPYEALPTLTIYMNYINY